MTAPCPVASCDRPRPGHLTICGACAGELDRALKAIPWLAAELDVALSRQTSKTTGGRSTVIPLPYDPRASEAADVLRNTLVGWVRALIGDTPPAYGPTCQNCDHNTCDHIPFSRWPADDLASMGRWLLAQHGRLLRHPAVTEAHDELTHAVRQAERAVDKPADSIYAGPCDHCGSALYARPSAGRVQCRTPGCEGEYQVEDRRDWMRGQCEALLGSSAYVAMVCTGLGVKISPSTVRMWVHRKKLMPRVLLPPRSRDGTAQPLYRVGDVISVALGETVQYSA